MSNDRCKISCKNVFKNNDKSKRKKVLSDKIIDIIKLLEQIRGTYDHESLK